MGRHIQYADLSVEEFRKRARLHVKARERRPQLTQLRQAAAPRPPKSRAEAYLVRFVRPVAPHCVVVVSSYCDWQREGRMTRRLDAPISEVAVWGCEECCQGSRALPTANDQRLRIDLR